MNANGSQVLVDEINLIDYWRVVWKYRLMIITIVIVASVFAAVWSGFIPKIYKSEVVIIPVSGSSGSGLGALAQQFGGLSSFAGISLPSSGGDDASKLVILLKSRTMKERIINRENLISVLLSNNMPTNRGTDLAAVDMELAVISLDGIVTIADDKKNRTISISTKMKNPDLAARVANAYVDELQKILAEKAFTSSKRNRIYIEQQVEQNKRELLEAGKEINQFYRTNRISSSESKVDVNIDILSIAQVKGDELNGVLAKKSEVDQKISDAKVVKDVPQQVYLSYLQIRRELLAKINAMLESQYEMAKIEESKENLAFQVIDEAIPPTRKFGPKRVKICMLAFFASLMGAVFLAFFLDYIKKMRESPQGLRQSL